MENSVGGTIFENIALADSFSAGSAGVLGPALADCPMEGIALQHGFPLGEAQQYYSLGGKIKKIKK